MFLSSPLRVSHTIFYYYFDLVKYPINVLLCQLNYLQYCTQKCCVQSLSNLGGGKHVMGEDEWLWMKGQY